MTLAGRSRRASSMPQANASGAGLRRHRPDYLLPLLALVLILSGIIVIFTIGPGLAAQRNVSENFFVNKQMIAMLLGFVAFFIGGQIPVSFWRQYVWVFVALAAVGAAATALFGDTINGATRWLSVGGFSFQAAELIKFAYLFWVARLLSGDALLAAGGEQKVLKQIGISLAIVGVVVAVLQSDLGSTVVMMAMVGGMLFVSGVNIKKLVLVAGAILIAGVLAIAATPYRRDRLMTFMNPEQDCLSTGYQACQALIAVGTGGVFGKGLARGVQAYGYLPFAENDSIFAIYSEKFGFLGTTLFLLVYGVLLYQIIKVARRAPDMFSRLVAMGIFMWLATQASINVGAMIGLLPLKGITLPLVSYGGTSLIFVLAALGVVFHISRYTRRFSMQTVQEVPNGNISDRRRVRRTYHTVTRGRA